MIPFVEMYVNSKTILMEGAISERLKREYQIQSDNSIGVEEHLYNENSKTILLRLFREYIEIANTSTLPMMICTPTRRANQ